MNKFLKSIALFVLLFAITACEDMINADTNIIREKVEYQSVKSDQTNNVILPLAIGNTWLYQVDEFDKLGNITNSYIDSIVVYDEVLVNGERWFKMRFPMGGYGDTVLMTNTNLGLWYKCTNCDEKSALKAQYPVKDESFIGTSYQGFIYKTDSTNGLIPINVEVQHNVDISNNIPISYNDNNFSAIKYTLSLKIIHTEDVQIFGKLDETFIPNIGLYYSKQYYDQGPFAGWTIKTFTLLEHRFN